MRNASFLALLLLLGCAGASPPLPTPEERMPTADVHVVADIERLAGQQVSVHGTYRLLDVRQRQKGAPVLLGHAAVELSDGHRVLLEPIWSEGALRPDAERALDGAAVVAEGTLHATAPEPPEPVAQITAPTLSPVTAVKAR